MKQLKTTSSINRLPPTRQPNKQSLKSIRDTKLQSKQSNLNLKAPKNKVVNTSSRSQFTKDDTRATAISIEQIEELENKIKSLNDHISKIQQKAASEQAQKDQQFLDGYSTRDPGHPDIIEVELSDAQEVQSDETLGWKCSAVETNNLTTTIQGQNLQMLLDKTFTNDEIQLAINLEKSLRMKEQKEKDGENVQLSDKSDSDKKQQIEPARAAGIFGNIRQLVCQAAKAVLPDFAAITGWNRQKLIQELSQSITEAIIDQNNSCSRSICKSGNCSKNSISHSSCHNSQDSDNSLCSKCNHVPSFQKQMLGMPDESESIERSKAWAVNDFSGNIKKKRSRKEAFEFKSQYDYLSYSDGEGDQERIKETQSPSKRRRIN